jgi:pimeloyl-ACP methyl ester carboxylesterase
LSDDVRRLYPWEGADLELPSGHRLHYVDTGAGRPLLFVHGNPTWSFYWRRLIADLSVDHRCVAVDHLGAGLSDKPADGPYTLQAHIDRLVALIDLLDLRDVTLVVHDWGGPIGFGAACARHERFSRLVLFNTSVFLEHVPLSIRMARWPGVGEAVVQGLNGFVRAGLLRAFAHPSRVPADVKRGFLAPYPTPADRVGHLGFIRDIPVEPDHPTRPVVERLTRDVPALLGDRPALILWGDRDFVFTPRFLERWRQILPHAEVHRFPDAAHWVVEDAHDRIVPLLRAFLSAH